MKKIIFIANLVLMLMIVSCEEEASEEDYIIAKNNSIYEQYYSDTIAVLVKSRYIAKSYLADEFQGDTLFAANTLLMKEYDSDNWLFLEKLVDDSSMYVAKWDGTNKKIYLRYSDSLLYVKNFRHPELDTIMPFDSIFYPDIEDYIYTLPVDTAYIDSINNSQWYISYEDWINDIMEFYW